MRRSRSELYKELRHRNGAILMVRSLARCIVGKPEVIQAGPIRNDKLGEPGNRYHSVRFGGGHKIGHSRKG